ncbi:MscS family membrane protein [Hydrogenivirga caldilitoris]|uniref:MscS family membrane protein n=1 Tax=Hydrogenivirga caldilitoris TaxID=246264 RepID=A0A497XM37_9AQUI|nr:mechanosensitive ion channel family protein [Hydrogenivirga caldilitoris]RLJ69956.1 MscS family membrane protein [Hydrogenivirga caldilitoris]
MESLVETVRNLQEYLNFVILGTPLYRFILALLVLFLFFFFRKLFTLVAITSLRKLVRRTPTEIDDIILRAWTRPISFLVVIAGIGLSLAIIGIESKITLKVIKTLAVFTLGWMSFNLVTAFEDKFYEFAQRFGRELSREIGGFLVKLTKAFIILVIGVAILQEWGINVSALLASVGLLGLAVSLAAKDTLENIISGFVILLDKPILSGESGQIAGVQGTVEEIGLRSTKIRTFDKTLVSIPNKEVVNQNIDNWSRRDKRRVRTYIGLVYSTTREQMENILRDIRDMLANHPRVSKEENFYVHFEVFGDSSLNILLQYYTDTADYAEYLKIVEDINLKIMEIVERNGSSFAFPSRSLYLEKLPSEVLPLNNPQTRRRKSS